ncbi:MAG: TonB-dependent receptor [Pseudomonadota bacterium]
MKSLLILSTASLCFAGFSATATAQDANDAEELRQNTITVTVQKREQDLRDVPVAVSAVDSETLNDLGLAEFDQLARFVPGFEVQEQSPNNPGFVIRGITSDSGESNIEPRIAVFQDGVSISRSRGSIVELYDLERVEVAKGPQPTLFGRGALIGGVNIIQAKPEFDWGGKATIGAGNLNEIFAEGHITGPIMGDQVAFRLSGRLRERDGYVESVNPDEEDFNSQDMKAIRASLRIQPSEALNIDIIANWQEDNPSGTSFKSGAFEPGPGLSTAPFDPANLNAFGDPAFLGDDKLGLDRTVQGLTILADYEINETFSLTSITGYRDFESLEVFDPDGFGLPLFVFTEDAEGEQFSQELRLNIDWNDNVRGFVGANYFDETGSQAVPLTYDERAVQALLAGLLVPPTVPDVETLPGINLTVFGTSGDIVNLKPIHNEIFTNFGDTTSYELFGDISIDLSDRVEVTGGVRYTYDEKSSGLLVELPEGPSLLTFGGIFVQPTAGLPAADANGLIEASDEFDDLTWRAAVKYAATDNINLYGNYARGRRPEVITASAATPQAGFATLDSELVDAFEAGFKSRFLNGDLTLNGSVFYYDYSNFQTTEVNEQGLIVPINAGDATAEGAELEASYQPMDSFVVTASYGYNKARFDEEEGAPFSGNRLRLSPDQTASLAAKATIDTELGVLSVVPSMTWQSQVFFDNTERNLLSEDAYVLFNLNLQLDITDTYFVSAYVSNLFDEEYIIDAGNTGDAFGIPTFIAGPPRFAGVRLGAQF